MSRLRSAVVVALVTVIGFVGGPTPSADAAAQHQYGAINVSWDWTGSGVRWNVDQVISVSQRAPSTYWALVWGFDGAGEGGYMGLQTDGTRSDGSRGDTAIFSLWGADAARGGSCTTFGGEGVGQSCRMPWTVRTGTQYRLRVWRLESDAGGQWWGAWITDPATGQDRHIGDIRVPRVNHTWISSVGNFSEYFGEARSCDQVPVSRALFTQPAANSQGAGRYEQGSRYAAARTSRGACTGGAAAVQGGAWPGVVVALGGPR